MNINKLKKEAKRNALSNNTLLSKELDLIAKIKGFVSWGNLVKNKASTLNVTFKDPTPVDLRLPTHSYPSYNFASKQSLNFIIGSSGSGKTILSLEIIEQALSQKYKVLRIHSCDEYFPFSNNPSYVSITDNGENAITKISKLSTQDNWLVIIDECCTTLHGSYIPILSEFLISSQAHTVLILQDSDNAPKDFILKTKLSNVGFMIFEIDNGVYKTLESDVRDNQDVLDWYKSIKSNYKINLFYDITSNSGSFLEAKSVLVQNHRIIS